MSVYPNPAADELTIEVQGAPAGMEMTIEFYNLTGTLVQECAFENSVFNKISIKKLPQSIYLYKIMNISGILKSDRIVIIRGK
ncbi:MAG: T9SS type A sorting domain-containing protein [Bacteroidota bacterium]